MAVKKTFASDNYAGVHPEVMDALVKANTGHQGSYGNDDHTRAAVANFRKHFGESAEVFFAYNGTGANVLGLSILTQSFNSIICSDLAHINVDESTAPEKFLGCKLLTIPTKDGKIYPGEIEDRIIRVGDQHHPQARVISISQTSEYATVYTVEEVKAISVVAKKHNLFLHMDGSRIANAATALGKSFREFTVDAGVDVLSFGGTKNGLMFGEAILVFNPALAANLHYIRKQAMQLHSKMRFISAQFNALIATDLWKRNADHANKLAARLANGLKQFPAIKITQKVDANGVFAIMPAALIPQIQEHTFFYVWNNKTNEVRLMCSWDTQESDVDLLLTSIKQALQSL
jgi:threonine aldolase